MSRRIASGRGKSGPWEVELDIVKSCSKGPTKRVVWLGRVAKTKIDVLMRKYTNQEWFAYLLGEELRVHDIFVPEQRAGQNFISNVQCKEYNELNIIGAMHSHPWVQGNNFSGHDDEFVNGNHDISLLVSKSGMSGQVRVKVPCGAMFIVPADVRLDLEIDFNKKTFIEEVEEKINKKIQRVAPAVSTGAGIAGGHAGLYPTTTPAGEMPLHMQTFPTHHPGCACSQCQQDRRHWLKLQNQKKGQEGWNTEETEGSWICEECQKLNYEDKDKDVAVSECAWCGSSRPESETATIEDEVEVFLQDLETELKEFESMFVIETEVNQEMQEAIDKKYDETMDKLDEEVLLDASLEIAAKFLVLIKQLYDGSVYKVQFDLFSDKLAVDFAESEDSISDELHIVVKKIEDQLESSEPETVEEETIPVLYGKVDGWNSTTGKIHLVPKVYATAAVNGQGGSYACGVALTDHDDIDTDLPTGITLILRPDLFCKRCFSD